MLVPGTRVHARTLTGHRGQGSDYVALVHDACAWAGIVFDFLLPKPDRQAQGKGRPGLGISRAGFSLAFLAGPAGSRPEVAPASPPAQH